MAVYARPVAASVRVVVYSMTGVYSSRIQSFFPLRTVEDSGGDVGIHAVAGYPAQLALHFANRLQIGTLRGTLWRGLPRRGRRFHITVASFFVRAARIVKFAMAGLVKPFINMRSLYMVSMSAWVTVTL